MWIMNQKGEKVLTSGNQVADQSVVVLCSQQGAGEHNTVEWHIVFSHEVVELHLVVKTQHCTVRMTSY